LDNVVIKMFVQKQKMGLINPNWIKPNILKDIVPVLIISEYNIQSSAKIKFDEILRFMRIQHGEDFLNNLQTYNYTLENGLLEW
jgi:hypothetical protein